jgi:hypothetical protein
MLFASGNTFEKVVSDSYFIFEFRFLTVVRRLNCLLTKPKTCVLRFKLNLISGITSLFWKCLANHVIQVLVQIQVCPVGLRGMDIVWILVTN